MKEFEDILTKVALIAIAVLGVLIAIRLRWILRTRHQRRSVSSAPAGIVILRIASALGLAVLGYGFVTYLFVLLRGSAFMPAVLKTILAALLLGLVVLEIIAHLRPRLPASRAVVVRGIAGAVASWAIGVFLTAQFLTASQYPDEGDDLLIGAPFHGEWVATGAGATSSTNHHNRIPSQRFAIDIAKACDNGRLFRGEGKELDESCTFGAAVLAPVDGVVVHTVDGLSDLGSKQELAGNHVIIRMSDTRYVALAHLQENTVAVARGDTVHRGQQIGRAGNSGNSDFPHLHIHVQNSEVYDIRSSLSIPFRFGGAEVKRYFFWRRVARAALLRNDRIRFPNGTGSDLVSIRP